MQVRAQSPVISLPNVGQSHNDASFRTHHPFLFMTLSCLCRFSKQDKVITIIKQTKTPHELSGTQERTVSLRFQTVIKWTNLVALVARLSWFARLSHFALDFTASHRGITQRWPATVLTRQDSHCAHSSLRTRHKFRVFALDAPPVKTLSTPVSSLS